MSAWIAVHIAFCLVTMAIDATTHLVLKKRYIFWRSVLSGLLWPVYLLLYLLVVWFYTRDKLDIQEILQKVR